jgi:hypothetical protein
MTIVAPRRRIRSRPLPIPHLAVSGELTVSMLLVLVLIQSFGGNDECCVMSYRSERLPRARFGVPLSERGPTVVITESGELGLDGEATGLADLSEKLVAIREGHAKIQTELARRDPRRASRPFDGHLIVMGDAKADSAAVLGVAHAAWSTGWEHLDLVVRN